MKRQSVATRRCAAVVTVWTPGSAELQVVGGWWWWWRQVVVVVVRGRGVLWVRWDHAPGGEVREEIHRYGGVHFWVAIFSTCTSDFTIYHYSFSFFWISQPMHGVSLWRQQNEKKKKIIKKETTNV